MAVRVRAQMPGDRLVKPPKPIASNRGWWIGAAGLVVVMVWSAVEMIRAAGHPNGYRGRSWDVAVDGPWPFPTGEVGAWILVMLVQGMFGIWWLGKRSTSTIGVRSLTFGLLMLLGLICLIPLGIHASAPLPQYFAWAFLASTWSIVFACAWGITHLLTRASV